MTKALIWDGRRGRRRETLTPEAKQGPGEGGSLGGSSLNICLELGSGDTKVSKLDTCLLLWGMTLPGTEWESECG